MLMRLLVSIAAAVCACAGSMADAAGREPIVLEPAGQWTADYADERCSLVREFHQGDHTLKLQIDSYGARHSLRFLVVGDLARGSSGTGAEVTFGLSPDRTDRGALEAVSGTLEGQQAVSFVATLAPGIRDIDRELLNENNDIKP